MARSPSQYFISQLIKEGELIEIDTQVSPKLEVTEITDRFSKLKGGGKALLFKNNGTDFPILINSLGSLNRINIAFGGNDPDSLAKMMENFASDMTKPPSGLLGKLSLLPKLKKVSSWMPKKLKRKGRCQEIIMDNPDLNKLPVLTCWPHDGGPFITFPLVHSIDPNNGNPNLGMYRMQVFDSNTTGMHWHMHKTGARHYNEYKKRGELMPVAVALGGDPVYTYSATAPLPDGIDEYLLAGYIRQKKVQLVKCLTQNLWVPEDADIIIEGYVDPKEDLIYEGPFGDHTGFYSLADYFPKFHVTCITHRKKAIYPTTIVGIPPQEDAWIAVATEKLFLPPIKMSMIPELLDMHMPEPGVAHNIAVFSINATYPGQGKKVLNTIWGAGQMMFNKFAIVTDSNTDIRNYRELLKSICRRVNPANDLSFSQGPMDILDHSADSYAYGGKLGLDATGIDLQMDIPSENDLLDCLAPLRVNNPEIGSINVSLLNIDIPVGIVSFKKVRQGQFSQLANDLMKQLQSLYLPFWVFVDDTVNVNDLYQVTWIIGSHTDPIRDSIKLVNNINPEKVSLFLDATRKTKSHDGFKRDWPNPVLMDKETIKKVDEKWKSLRAGQLLPSPSEYYRPLEEDGDAVVKE